LVGALVVVAALAVQALSAPAASASIPGPGSLFTGFADEVQFVGPIDWPLRAERLGSTWVRLFAAWNGIAPLTPPRGFRPADPRDPRYNFFNLDAFVGNAAAHRQSVVMTILGAPAWAEGAHRPPAGAPQGTWRPNPAALGAFARALAVRYSGHFPNPTAPRTMLPRVSYFQIWNEPNLRIDLTPQWVRRGRTFVPQSPVLYRRMLNAAYANIKAVQPTAHVLLAGTAPYGDPPGVDRMMPVVFTRELLCLHGPALRRAPCPNPAHFDAIAHHPYTLTPTLHAFNQDNVSLPDLGKLQRIVRVAVRTGRAVPAGPKPMWVTELAWTSRPPDPGGISTATQARYLSRAFYELWRQGVSHVFWLEIRDPPAGTNALLGSGVYFNDGRAKQSSGAFRFPFVALPARRGMITLWGRAPVAGNVSIELGRGHGWQSLFTLHTTSGGIFYARRRLGGHLVLRAAQGRVASRPWATG
jgi:hypothetical protein